MNKNQNKKEGEDIIVSIPFKSKPRLFEVICTMQAMLSKKDGMLEKDTLPKLKDINPSIGSILRVYDLKRF